MANPTPFAPLLLALALLLAGCRVAATAPQGPPPDPRPAAAVFRLMREDGLTGVGFAYAPLGTEYLVTAQHVVEMDPTACMVDETLPDGGDPCALLPGVDIVLPGGGRLPGRAVWAAPHADLAVLRVPGLDRAVQVLPLDPLVDGMEPGERYAVVCPALDSAGPPRVYPSVALDGRFLRPGPEGPPPEGCSGSPVVGRGSRAVGVATEVWGGGEDVQVRLEPLVWLKVEALESP